MPLAIPFAQDLETAAPRATLVASAVLSHVAAALYLTMAAPVLHSGAIPIMGNVPIGDVRDHSSVSCSAALATPIAMSNAPRKSASGS